MKEKLLTLISDPNFIKLQNLINEPNFYKIVGRTHTERWHSSFWGWLLDISGSHNLEDYAISRLFTLLISAKVLPAKDLDVTSIFPYKKIEKIETRPNEQDNTEVSVKLNDGSKGHFDIFIDMQVINIKDEKKKIVIIIELKVDARITAEQSKKYGDWLHKTHPNNRKYLLYFLPEASLNKNSLNTVGDDRWNCLSYQLLHDNLLIPILQHPSLSVTARSIIEQYVKNMRITNRGIKMATTQEEKDLVNYLYDKYADVFDNIFQVLSADEKNPASYVLPQGRGKGNIKVKLDNLDFKGKGGADLLKNILHYLVDSQKIVGIPLPWGLSSQRYILTNQNPPVHPNGKDFFAPIEYKTYVIETNMDRSRAVKVISDIADYLNLEFELVEI